MTIREGMMVRSLSGRAQHIFEDRVRRPKNIEGNVGVLLEVPPNKHGWTRIHWNHEGICYSDPNDIVYETPEGTWKLLGPNLGKPMVP